MARSYWLLKSDPATFGLSHLKRSKNRTTCWDGVRNFQARNLLRDRLKVGDGVLFYHSQADPPAVVATAEVVRAGYPDPEQFRPSGRYYDPRSKRDEPRWYAVDIRLERELARPVTLPEIRETPGLEEMVLVNRSRLSVQPVTAGEWRIILRLGARKTRKAMTGGG
jgi:predicted RNA-binding protein with PUA-like domain